MTSPDWKPSAPPVIQGRHSRIILDTETTGLDFIEDKPLGIVCTTPEGSSYLPWGHASGNLDEAVVKEWARRELRDVDVWMHKAKYDVHMFLNWGIDLEAQGVRVHDTANAAALIDEKRRLYNLDVLSRDYLGKRKLDIQNKADMARKPAWQVAGYAMEDGVLTGELRDVFDPLIAADGLGRVLELEDRLIYCVVQMERNGAIIDVDLLDRWIRESQRKVEQAIFELNDLTQLRIDPDSGKDMAEKLFPRFRLPITLTVPTLDKKTGKWTKGGTPSFTDDILKGIEEGHPDPKVRRSIQLVRWVKKLNSLRSKYLLKYKKALGGSNVLRYNLHQLGTDDYGTVTGRFSSSDVNIQQVYKPSRQKRETGVGEFIIRQLFLPAEGRAWMSADARQIELRLAAHFCAEIGMTRLEKAYAKDPDVDFHDFVMGITGQNRDDTKNWNFMKLFGGGVGRAMEMTGRDEATCARQLQEYDDAFPEFKRLMRRVSDVAEDRGYVKTVFGRRRRFADEKNPRYYSGLNAVIQGTAADVMKVKMLEFYNRRAEFGFLPRMTVHDELDGDVPMDAEVGRRTKTLLDEQRVKLRVPILWDVKMGANWAQLKNLDDYNKETHG